MLEKCGFEQNVIRGYQVFLRNRQRELMYFSKHVFGNILLIRLLVALALSVILFAYFNPKSISAAREGTLTKPFIRVSPVILNITLSPGKSYEYDLKVDNLLSSPLPVRAVLDNFEPTDEDNSAQTQISPLVSWITYDPKDMIIPAKTQKIIHLKVNIPSRVPVGGYYATLYLEPVLPSQRTAQTTSIHTRIGVIMLANIGVPGLTRQAEIIQFSFDKWLYEKGPVKLTFRTKNLSLYHFSAKPFVILKPLFGPARKLEIEEKIILPGKSRNWTKDLELPDYWHGLYKATLAVSVGNGQQIIRSTYIFGLPFNKLAIFIGLIVLFLFVIRRRKNWKKFFRTLFHP